MKRKLSSANTSFNYLASSSEFLNTVINNISSCVLFLNDQMELQAYNDALKTIFSNVKDEHVLYMRCGEAIGCAFSVEEQKRCGETSQCKNCELRESALHSYVTKKPVYKEKISREFFISNTEKILKHLQFSTRIFYFERDYYILLIVDDISKVVDQEETIKEQEEVIKKLSEHQRN